ncbi:hypothetical protein SAMN04487819_10110 [Actinopolyspora alba]|uniref:Uncharacterized protein n=1 Tax=Actinopolyspora alba TaxID=673379 RepID=A0A1I1TBL7_9ACTN|nr:hypothetical protein SAMN04487819_10110 [Actinopolyspora alba]
MAACRNDRYAERSTESDKRTYRSPQRISQRSGCRSAKPHFQETGGGSLPAHPRVLSRGRPGVATARHRAASGESPETFHRATRENRATDSRQQDELVWVSSPSSYGSWEYSPPAFGSLPW